MIDTATRPIPDMKTGGDDTDGISNQLTVLDFISNLLTESSFDLQPLLNEIVRVTAEAMHMKACTIRLLDDQTGEMKLKATHGLSSAYLSKGPVIAGKSIFRQLLDQCCQQDDIVEIYDVAVDTSVQYAREAVSEGIRSLVAAPLVRDGRSIGALTVFTAVPHRFTEEERSLFKTIANNASIAVSLAQLYEEKLELRQIEHELEIASDIQRKLLPSKPPKLSGYDIAGTYHPCHEVGGDFFDFIELPDDNLGIALGDVAGKGIPAALLMATVRTALRVQAENIYAMRDVVGRVNRAVYEDTRADEFVTLFYGVLNAEDRMLTYVNAGHNTAILVRNGEIRHLEPGGPPVGILPNLLAGEERLKLEPGDALMIFTDGYPDAPGATGEMFGEDRVRDVLRNAASQSAVEIIARLNAVVETFSSESAESGDDRTMVVVKVEG